MNKQLALLALLPALVMFVSGCTFLDDLLNPQASTRPLITLDLKAVPDRISGGEDINLIATIENKGMAWGPVFVSLYSWSEGLFRPVDYEMLDLEISSIGMNEKREIIWKLEQYPVCTVNDVVGRFNAVAAYQETSTSSTMLKLINNVEKDAQIREGTWKVEEPKIEKGGSPVTGWIDVVDTHPVSVGKNTPYKITLSINIEDRSSADEGSVWLGEVYIDELDLAYINGENQITLEEGCLPPAGEPVKLIAKKYKTTCRAIISEKLTNFDKEIAVPIAMWVSYVYSVEDEAKVTIEVI